MTYEQIAQLERLFVFDDCVDELKMKDAEGNEVSTNPKLAVELHITTVYGVSLEMLNKAQGVVGDDWRIAVSADRQWFCSGGSPFLKIRFDRKSLSEAT